jgi:DNA-binding MarR family transcriptional regulator
LGQLIAVLDGIEQNREFRLLKHQERLRRNPISAMAMRAYEAALAWRPDEGTMPGISRIELLCDSLPGEPGITAAKVRRLRADICRRSNRQIPHADVLTLDEAADILEGVHRVSLEELEAAQQQQLHHGMATLDMIQVGVEPGQVVEVTGLSCKVVRGSSPTACPDANPVLPPSLLGVAERAIRRLYPLPPGMTIHWVGHDTGLRSRCRCVEYRGAAFAAPFDQARWSGDVSAPATVAGSAPGGEAGAVGAGTAQLGGSTLESETGHSTNETPGLDAAAFAVLTELGNAYPKLLKNVEIEVAAGLSKQTVTNAVADLIGRNLAARPRGQRKGATATARGLALLERVRNSSADHP